MGEHDKVLKSCHESCRVYLDTDTVLHIEPSYLFSQATAESLSLSCLNPHTTHRTLYADTAAVHGLTSQVDAHTSVDRAHIVHTVHPTVTTRLFELSLPPVDPDASVRTRVSTHPPPCLFQQDLVSNARARRSQLGVRSLGFTRRVFEGQLTRSGLGIKPCE